MIDEIYTLFQPVVGLRTGLPFAYEAYSRGPSDEGVFDPRSLFMAALEQSRLVDLDLRCMDLAIERAVEHGLLAPGSPALFVNTLPDTLHAPGFAAWLGDTLERTGAQPTGLVVEVNEGWRIEDYGVISEVLDELRERGIRTAVDDAGAGHSGLRVVADLRPDFVKIDRELIRGVQSEPGRAAILETFVTLADRLTMEVVAEGVEDVAELGVVSRMNIPYAQGYLIGRPGSTPAVDDGWPAIHAALIRPASARGWSTSGPIGALAEPAPTAQADTTLREVAGLFEAEHPPGSVVVLDGEELVGLVTRQRLSSALAQPHDHASRKRIDTIADREAVVVDFGAPVEVVARRADDRADPAVYDPVIVLQEGHFFGTVTVRQMLTALSSKQIEVARHASPLSGLPGSPVLEQEARRRLAVGGDVALVHVDIDNLKAFNDRYGFRHGDDAIRALAAVLEDVAAEHPDSDIFLGHSGGDDFALVLDPPSLEPVGNAIAERFDREVPGLHPDEDRERGFYVGRTGTGEDVEYPLLAVTISAAISPADHPYHYLELTEAVAETGASGKQRTGSGSQLFIDRRQDVERE